MTTISAFEHSNFAKGGIVVKLRKGKIIINVLIKLIL